MDRTFGYAVDRRFLPILLPFGFRCSKDGVTITDAGELEVTFGVLSLRTPLANVAGSHVTGNYRWWRAIGARLSFVDDGLTFGTNTEAGVCIHFRERVPTMLRRKGHSALTVTIQDPEGFVAVVGGRGASGGRG